MPNGSTSEKWNKWANQRWVTNLNNEKERGIAQPSTRKVGAYSNSADT
jgi:hypothetical protein